MKNLTEQDIRAAVRDKFGKDTPVYFKLLEAKENFNLFPYYFIKGKKYKLWICACPDGIRELIVVAIPGLEGVKTIPSEVFGDFTKAQNAVVYAMYKGTIPQDYSGLKYDFCKDKDDYRVIRNFGKGLQLIPEWYLNKKAILQKAQEKYPNCSVTAVGRIFGAPDGEKKVCWQIYIASRNLRHREQTYIYFDIAAGEFVKSPFAVIVKDRIPLQQHGGIVVIDNIEFKYDGQKLSWGR